MADKPTKRERKDEAKKRRLEEMRRRQRRARMRKMYTWSVFAAIIAALVVVVLINRGHTSKIRNAAAKLAAAAGCEPPKSYAIEGRDHIAPPQTVQYKTDPPTSGNHYGTQNPPAPTATGVHPQPIQNEVEVHNLEHGHILIQYKPGSLSDALLTKLGALVQKNAQWVILAPRENKVATVALTAWGIKQRCDAPNDKLVDVATDFIKRFRNNGPESFAGTPIPAQPQQQPPQPSAPPTAAPTGSTSVKPTATASK